MTSANESLKKKVSIISKSSRITYLAVLFFDVIRGSKKVKATIELIITNKKLNRELII